MKTTPAAGESTEELLSSYATTRDPRLRARIIERHEGLVRSVAYRFARPGIEVEDLVQCGWIALIGAVDRFDPVHETRFSTYATYCIGGEIKRYFRDRTWALKVPRRLREISASLASMQDRLYRQLQREPTVPEMAAALQATEEELLRAMELRHAYHPLRLDDHRNTSEGDTTELLADAIGTVDVNLERVVDEVPLQAALETLDEREQRIIRRRFMGGWTQVEVAAELGLSQMHISRLERRALKDLREVLSNR